MTSFAALHRQAVLDSIRDSSGHDLCERYTYAVDTLVLESLDEALRLAPPEQGADRLPDRWALMALGGYGREQMCLRSDIDIQLVVPDGAPDPQPLMEVFLDRLTRRGLRLGHGVRTVTEALWLAREEPTFATAALTARHLAGDPATTEAVRSPIHQHLTGQGLASLLEFVQKDRARRSERLGDTVYVLEPDLKLGIGGLRDTQLVGWLALATGRPFDPRVAFAEDLLLRIRMALHALVAFKCDRLAFDYQDAVAEALGYEAGADESPAIGLMRDVHLAMRVGASRARRHLEITADRLRSPPRVGLPDHPRYVRIAGRIARADGAVPRSVSAIVEALRVVAATDLPLEAWLENGFEELAQRLSRDRVPVSADPALAALLVELLEDPRRGASMAMHVLHRTGLLVSLVPEFEAVLGRVARDLYHVFTVDEHILRALDKLKAIARGEHPELQLASERLAAIRATGALRPLVVAMFLHDLGKGYGPGHHERGAELADRIGPRLGLTPDEVEDVRLLVLHQADMPLVCQRRDLADPRPVRSLARTVGDVPTLDALFLLSIADWSSVGPQAFSNWHRTLIDGLYLRTRDLLLHPGLYADPRGIADLRRQELLLAELGEVPTAPGAASDPIDDFCSALPTRYFQGVDVPTMQRHFRLWQRFQDEDRPAIEVIADPAHDQVVITIVCADAPGVLARLTGGLASAGVDLVSAELHSLAGVVTVDTQGSGTVLDVFRAADPHGRFAQPRAAQAITDGVTRAIAGEPIALRQPDSFAPSAALPPIRAEVTASNDVASEHTVIDVIAGDRPGLLHDIARFFHGERVSVDLAFIATEGRVARDSFYVLDAERKMLDDTRARAIADRLRLILGTTTA
ncbi:MAG: HD domain-containing protein [Deltaproteobacteria bacterium]|nr:HD domain-containing protein [Deltaproteobacteria bacterium]